MSEVQAPPEVIFRILSDVKASALEVDKDCGEEVVVNIVTALVFFHQKSDIAQGQDAQEFVHLRLPDYHDPVLGALLLGRRETNMAERTTTSICHLDFN